MATAFKYITLTLCFFLSTYSDAQYFATMQVNTKNIYKQQPIKATLTVYTSTWFTDAPDLGNFNVPNSFVLPFKRTVSGIQYVDKKQYSTLTFFYLIFPYETGEIIIPDMDITISTPPEGDFKGISRKLTTQSITINVKDAPKSFAGTNWLVAKNGYISEKWNKSLSEVKVGDVIERTITIRATGTLPSFIPPSQINDVSWASIYPKEPLLKDTRTREDANGVRIEKYRYLLEKEGTFEIEPLTVYWWNPYLNKQYSRSSKEQTIVVKPNPNLGMLTTMRDSLQTKLPSINQDDKDEAFSFLGLSLKNLLLIMIGVLISTWLLLKITMHYRKALRERKKQYLKSEKYWFDRVLKTHNKGNKEQLNAIYNWLLRRKDKQYTVNALRSYEASELLKNTLTNNKKLLNKRNLKSLDKKNSNQNEQKDAFPPLNP